MDKLKQINDKLEEMKGKYILEKNEEDYPLHSNGYGMYWSGFFACLKEVTSIIDTVRREGNNPYKN